MIGIGLRPLEHYGHQRVPAVYSLERQRQLLGARIAIDWATLQTSLDHAHEIVRNGGAPLAQFARGLGQDVAQNRGQVFTFEGQRVRQEFVADDGQCPDIAGKAMPGLALAKGLAKSESDGSLSWLVELDAERSIKVNGIPFGKAPE